MTDLISIARSMADTCCVGAREHAVENRDLLRAAVENLPPAPAIVPSALLIEAADCLDRAAGFSHSVDATLAGCLAIRLRVAASHQNETKGKG